MLAHPGSHHVTPHPSQNVTRVPVPDVKKTERTLLIAALLSTASALILTLLLARGALRAEIGTANNLKQVYDNLVVTRSITGALLIIAWPAILHLAARALKFTFARPGHFLTLLGVSLGSLTYAATFLPWPTLAVAPVVPLVAALFLFPWALHAPLRNCLKFWVVQGSMALGTALLCIWALESAATGQPLNPLRELPEIYRFGSHHVPAEQSILPMPSGRGFPAFSWPSTGSDWLDRRANRTRIVVSSPAPHDDWIVRLKTNAAPTPIDLSRHTDNSWSTNVFVPKTETNYWIVVAPAGDGDVATVQSLLSLKRGAITGS